MRHLFASLTLSIGLVAAATAAPPLFNGVGDIATAGNTQLRIMAADGVTSAGYPIVGLSPSTSLWDPQNPDDIILGQGGNSPADGSLARASFDGPGNVAPMQFAPTGSFARPLQLSWDQTGDGIIVVTNYDQVHRVDATSGAVTDITSGAQPWGTVVSCGAMDRITGDIYVGTTAGEIWRLANGATGATLYTSGFGAIKKILVDTSSSPHYLYFATGGAIRRIALGGPPEAEPYFGTFGQVASPGSIVSFDFDEHGDFVIGVANRDLYRLANPADIPATGVAAVYLGQYAFPNNSGYIRDITVIGADSTPFRLTLQATPVLSAQIGLENAPGPIGVGFVFLSTTTYLPVGAGPFFGLMPDSLTLAVMNLPPAPGGLIAFTGTAPPPLVTFPQFSMAAYFGQTWDGVSVVFAPNGQLIGRSNIVRVTWQ